MKPIGRGQVRRLVNEVDAVVAEVLPQLTAKLAHLAPCTLPPKGWDAERIPAGFDREQPIVV